MRYLLDTNIISNVIKPAPSQPLLAWMAGQQDEWLFIASLTIAEIWRGVQETPPGRRRRQLENWFSGAEGPPTLFAGRILSFDGRAALLWGQLMADGKGKGRPRSAMDTIIGAVAQANSCIVVTDNEKDFEGIETLNPMRL